MTSAQKITPCLWFDLEAEQAVAQDEVDELWERGWARTERPTVAVGWPIKSVCRDRSCRARYPKMLQSGDAARTQRVMRAMFEMKKLDIAKLHRAFGPNQEEVS